MAAAAVALGQQGCVGGRHHAVEGRVFHRVADQSRNRHPNLAGRLGDMEVEFITAALERARGDAAVQVLALLLSLIVALAGHQQAVILGDDVELVLAETGRVRVLWDQAETSDVAGFTVYRRGTGEDWKALNEELRHQIAERSSELRAFLEEYRDLGAVAVEGEVESGKLSAIKEKSRRLRRLREKWGAPDPPWQAVSANLIWNIDNIPAAQVTMLGRLHGPSFASIAACSGASPLRLMSATRLSASNPISAITHADGRRLTDGTGGSTSSGLGSLRSASSRSKLAVRWDDWTFKVGPLGGVPVSLWGCE